MLHISHVLCPLQQLPSQSPPLANRPVFARETNHLLQTEAYTLTGINFASAPISSPLSSGAVCSVSLVVVVVADN